MTPIYGIVKESYILKKSKRTSYGIAAYANAEEDGTATILNSVRDVTTNRSKITALADTCNRLQLSEDHLQEVVMDFLNN